MALLKAGAAETREAKEGEKNDFAVWHEQAQRDGYQHHTVMRQRQKAPESAAEECVQTAYRTAR
jgi:hypothetical protein